MDGAYPYWDAYVSGLLSEDDNSNSCSTSFGSHPNDDDNNNNKAAWRLIQSRRQLKPVRLKNFAKKGPPKQINQEEYLRLIKRKTKSSSTVEDEDEVLGCNGNIIRWPEVLLKQKNLYTFTYHDDPINVDMRGVGPKDDESSPVDAVPSYANEFKGIRDCKTGMVGSFRPSSAPVPESKHPFRYHSGVDHKKLYYEADSIGDENAPDELVHVLSDNLFAKYHGLLNDSGDDDIKHGDGGGDVMKKSGIGAVIMANHHATSDHGDVVDVDEPDQNAHEVSNDPYNSNKIAHGGGGGAYGNHSDKNDDDNGDGDDDYNKHHLKSDHFKNLYRPKTAPELLTPGVALTGVIQYKKKSPLPRRSMSKVKSDLESAMRFDSFHLKNFDKAAVVDDKKPSSLHHTHVCNVRIPLTSPTMKTISSPTMSPTTLKDHRPLQILGPPTITIPGSDSHKKHTDDDVDYKNNYNNDFTPEKLRIKRSQPDFSPERLRKRYPSRVASKLIHAINRSSRRMDKQQQQQQQEELNTSYNHELVTTSPSNLAQSTTVVVTATAAVVDTANTKQTDRKNSGDVAIIEATPDKSKDDKKKVSIRDILNDKELFRKPLYPYISLNAARATRQWESKRSTAEALLESYKSSINSTGPLLDEDDNTNANAVVKPMKKMMTKKKKKKKRMNTDHAVVTVGAENGAEKEAIIINDIISEGNYLNMECQETPITTSAMVILDVPTFVVTAITETKHLNNAQESILSPIGDVVSNSPSAVAGTVPQDTIADGLQATIDDGLQATIDDGPQATVDDEVGQTSITEHILPPLAYEQHGNSLAAIITAWNVQDDATKSIISDTSSYHDEFELIWSSLMDVNGDTNDVKNLISTIGGDASIIPIEEEDIADNKDIADDTIDDAANHIISNQSDQPLLNDKLPSLESVPDAIIMNSVAVDSSLYNLAKDDTNHEESIDRLVVPSSMDVLVHVKSSNQILREKIESLKRKPSMRKGPSNDSILKVKDLDIGVSLNQTEESSLNRSEASMDDQLDTSSEPVTSRSSHHRNTQLGNNINNEKVLQQQILESQATTVESIHQRICADESDVHPTVNRSEESVIVVESEEVAVVSDTSSAPFSLIRSTAHPIMNESSIALEAVIDKTEVALKAVEFDAPLSFGESEEVVFEHLLSDEMRISNDDALYIEEFDLLTSDSLDYNDSSFLHPEDFDISMDKSEVPPIVVDKSEVAPIAENESEVVYIAENKSEVVPTAENESEVLPIAEDDSELVSTAENESEVAPVAENESAVAPIAENESTVDPIAENESEVVSMVEDESEVPSKAEDKSAVAPIAEGKSALVSIAQYESEVTRIVENESEVPPTAENESEVPPIAEGESEVAHIAEDESAIVPIAEGQFEVPPITVDESEVQPIAEDESEVVPLAEYESEVVPIVEDESAVVSIAECDSEIALITENESEVPPIVEDESEVLSIAKDESEDTHVAEDEYEVPPIAENEYTEAHIAEDESAAAPIAEEKYDSEVVPIVKDESEVPSTAENHSEVVPIAEGQSEVPPITVDESEVQPIVENESYVSPIAENDSAVVPIAEYESEVALIMENESEVPPIVEDESEVPPMAENEYAVAHIAENESEVAPIAEDQSTVAPKAEDEFEVAPTAEDDLEVAPIAENESEVPPIVKDEFEVVPIAEDQSEVPPITVDESEVQPIAENESDVSHIAENESEVPPIAEDEYEEVPIAEDQSEVSPITVVESEVPPITGNESKVDPIAENESEVVPIVVDESEVAHIAKDETEVSSIVEDEFEVPHIVEDESEVAHIAGNESKVVPIVVDESEVAHIAKDETEVSPIVEDEFEVPHIVEDESEVAHIAEDESEVPLIFVDKLEISPTVVVDSDGLTAKIHDSATRRVVVPLLQLPSVVNQYKDPPRIDQSYSSDLHIESRDSFITGTGTHSVDYDHWKSRDDSLYEDSRSRVYSEEGSSQYSSNLKLDSMVFLSQALLDEVSYDMMNSTIASVPVTTSPYALTMSFPVNFFVPIVASADQMIAITQEQQTSNTQYATYMLDMRSCNDLVVTIYNDLPGMDFEDMLVTENIVFQSGLDENFLLHLSNSVGWGRFSETDADMSSCYLRGSMIIIDDALKLILRLWHNFISWTVQTVPMHAALIEVVESALCETLGVVPDTTDVDHARSWEDDMLVLLDSGRKLHKKFIEEIIVKDELKSMLEKWEFDPRRSVYNDRSASLGLEFAEDIVLVEFRTLSMELYEKLCEQSIDLPSDESNEFKLSKYVLHDLMDDFRSKTIDVIMRFYENLEITSCYNSNVEDYLKSSINMIFQFELQVYRTHDWNAYYKKRGRLLTLLESSTYEGDIMKATKDAFDNFIYNDDNIDDDDNSDIKRASTIEFINSFKNELGTFSKIAVTPQPIEDESNVLLVTENESKVPPIAEVPPMLENESEVPLKMVTESEVAPIAEEESEMPRSDFDFGTIDIIQNKDYMDLAFGDDLDDDESTGYQYSKGWSQSQGSSPGSMHSNQDSSPSLLDPTSSP